jgi:hypothetical protein
MAVMYQTGATALTLAAITQQIYNVTDPPYNAPADGSSDAAAKINLAIAAASAAAAANGSGSIVLCPPGKYQLDSSIILLANVELSAEGAYFYPGSGSSPIAMLVNYNATTLPYDDFSEYGSAKGSFLAGNNHIAVRGGIWDALGVGTTAFDIMNFEHATDVSVHSARLLNIYRGHGIVFNAIDGATVAGCRFEGFSNGGATSFNTSEAVLIDLPLAAGNSPIMEYDETPSTNITIDGCTFQPSQAYMDSLRNGTTPTAPGPFGTLAGSHNTFSGSPFTNIKVVNCTMTGGLTGADGIHAYGWQGAVISANTFYNIGQYAIAIEPDGNNIPSSIVVSDNVIDVLPVFGAGTTSSNIGIALLGTSVSTSTIIYRCIISNNIVRSPFSDGVYVAFGHRCTIQGNIVEGSGGNSFNLTASLFCDVVGNLAYGPTGTTAYGYIVTYKLVDTVKYQSSYCTIRSNTLTKPGVVGCIRILDAVRTFVGSNTINLDGVTAGTGISIDSTSTGTIVVNNALDGTTDTGPATRANNF